MSREATYVMKDAICRGISCIFNKTLSFAEGSVPSGSQLLQPVSENANLQKNQMQIASQILVKLVVMEIL